MIPDAQVEEVRARADIVDVVGEFVSLKKSGKDYKALCPFHDERTPSFYVVPSKGFYKCFGCGASGDVFSFLMERQGMGFVDAVKWVARRAGVEIREAGGREEDPHRHLYEANAFARGYYRGELTDDDAGAAARRYLEERGIDDEVAGRFSLGYAPDAWRSLREAADHHGIGDDVLLEVGLLKESDRAQEPYDRFRNRVVFPIEDIAGRVVAFGGRIVGDPDDGVPKYLNSPESPIYTKGEVLYGLSWAKNAIRKEEAALVVEGYMDLVALAAFGVPNAVATLGTAMTEAQAGLLSRYADRAYLLFDSDRAGLRATFRAGDVLLAAGVHPSVVTLPPGKDPDDLVREEGVEALREHVRGAVDVLDRKVQILDEHDYFSSVDRRRSALDRLLPTIRATRDPAIRDMYLREVSERTGVHEETIRDELESRERRGAGSAGSGRRSGRSTSRRGGGGRRPSVPAGLGAERDLCLLLLKNRSWVERAMESVAPSEFQDPAYREIFEALAAEPEMQAAPETMGEDARRRMEALMAEDPERLSHAPRMFDELVAALRVRSTLRGEMKDLMERIRRATDDDERIRLMQDFERLRSECQKVGVDWSKQARAARADRVLDSRTLQR